MRNQPSSGSGAGGEASFSAVLDRFVEQMGLLCEQDNLPRIAGRVLGLLVVEGGPFSLRELAERLQVSRASVSTNARMLADVGILERVSKPGDRQDYYQLAPQPYHRLLTSKVRALRYAASFVAEAEANLPAERADAKQRLKNLAAFYEAAASSISELVDRFAADR
jgi:DNA-binding transcriptional regulator GbsR (MarR family)